MALIEFENKPSTKTPINAKNLNGNFDAFKSIGSIVITSTNTNPSSRLGGTWELFDKEFSWWAVFWDDANANNPFQKSDNTSSCNVGIVRIGHELRLRLEITTNVVLGETAVDLGTLNLEKLGITTLSNSIVQLPCFSDSGNGIASVTFGATGSVQSNEVITKDGNHNLAKGSVIMLNTVLNTYPNAMVDSSCNKFYWKRTA